MKLTILGCHSATPRANARPTSQVLEIKGRVILIDCGEGTQVALRSAGVKFARVKHIFISHLHGDHFFGLPGLISTFQLLGREAELYIYGPKGIKEAILLLMKLGNSYLSFPIYFHELSADKSQRIFEDEKITVDTIPLKHRVYTNGYLFKEKEGERRLNIDKIREYDIEVCYYQNIKNGKNITLDNGMCISNKELTFDPLPIQSYAFCSDTLYLPSIVPVIRGVRVLYHESTFLQIHEDLALKTMHSTACQAAKIAKEAGVEALILGHYSSRYPNKESFKKEAQTIFKNTKLAKDGRVFVFEN